MCMRLDSAAMLYGEPLSQKGSDVRN